MHPVQMSQAYYCPEVASLAANIQNRSGPEQLLLCPRATLHHGVCAAARPPHPTWPLGWLSSLVALGAQFSSSASHTCMTQVSPGLVKVWELSPGGWGRA